MRPERSPLGFLGTAWLAVAMAGACEPEPTPAPVVLEREVPAFHGCEPASLAVDGGGRFMLAVDCPAPSPGTMTAMPAPAPIPGTAPVAPTALPGSLDPLSGPVGTEVAGGVVVRASAAARLAAGAAGHVYLVDGGIGTAFQLQTVFTRNGGASWVRLASPDPASHFMEGRVAAEGGRVLFGALEIGREGTLKQPLPVRLWAPPSAGSLPVLSTTVTGGDDLAVHLRPGTSTVLLACRTSPRTLSLSTSEDHGASFGERREAWLAADAGTMLFTRDELLVVSAGGPLQALPLAAPTAPVTAGPETIAPGWPSSHEARAATVDTSGRLWMLTSSDGGRLSAWRLRRPSRQWTTPLDLGRSDGRVALAPSPDGSVLVAFTREGRLQLQSLSAPQD